MALETLLHTPTEAIHFFLYFRPSNPYFPAVITVPLEDYVEDILGKAQRGLDLKFDDIVAAAGITLEDWKTALEGNPSEETLKAVAGPLSLGQDALIASANRSWKPAPVDLPGVFMVNTEYGDMTVNAFLVWDEATKEAVVFDTGADCDDLLAEAERQGAKVRHLLITHTHQDHIFDMDRLMEKTGANAFVCEKEAIDGAESFQPGKTFRVGGLTIETRLTWGHAKGGITYVISGLSRPVAVVGDAMFAGSMGGGKLSYADALKTNREEILTLPDDTVICPGHGPVTTVGEEKQNNPFFPEFQNN